MPSDAHSQLLSSLACGEWMIARTERELVIGCITMATMQHIAAFADAVDRRLDISSEVLAVFFIAISLSTRHRFRAISYLWSISLPHFSIQSVFDHHHGCQRLPRDHRRRRRLGPLDGLAHDRCGLHQHHRLRASDTDPITILRSVGYQQDRSRRVRRSVLHETSTCELLSSYHE